MSTEVVPTSPPGAEPRTGRPPAITAGVLAQVALELFAAKGFEATTIEDIAAGAGISRRTFFRYFASKNDVVWGDFDAELEGLRAGLAEVPPDRPMMAALREAVVEFNRVDDAAVEAHRQRMALILGVPVLQAHSTLRYAAWRAVIAEFVARRCQVAPSEMLPQLVGAVCLGASVTAYEQWLARPGSDLAGLIDAAMGEVLTGFAGHEGPPPPCP
jgi:TetR/AcrR family transcriptional regulator, regulator of mycofactocin system